MNFWNEWCIPCLQELPALKAFWEAHANDGDVAMVGVVHDSRISEKGLDAYATHLRSLVAERVTLEPGEAPDWDEAERYLEALILEEIGDHLLELAGVDTRNDPRETWLDTVKDRLGADLAAFRADVVDDHDQIEEWDFLGGRVFASTGSPDDEGDQNSGHGWMSRLVDSGVLTAAGFHRVRKAGLDVAG